MPQSISTEVISPSGMTAAKAWRIHSIPNLLHDFDVKTDPVQLVPHCSIPKYAKAIPDTFMKVLWHASIGEKGGGGNAVELDPFWIAGEPYVMDYLRGDQQTSFEGFWSQWAPLALGQKMLKYILWNIKGPEFAQRHVPTAFPITPLLGYMSKLLSLNSAATLFLDGHNEDAAKLVALLSNHPAYQDNALVLLHPHAFQNGAKFVEMVNTSNLVAPAITWERAIAVASILDPDALPNLAGVECNSLNYTALYTAGQAWLSSMINTEMKIFGLGFPASGIGHGVDLTTGITHDLNGNLVTELRVKAMFLWDRILLDLVAWAKKTHPILPIIMHSRYSYEEAGHYINSFHKIHMGHPVFWPEDVESHKRELMAMPGNALKLGANIVICDHIMT